MPTLKDIQEQLIIDNTNRIYVKTVENPDGELFIYKEVSEFFNKLTTLAFQAGEKSKEDMVLKEIEGMKKEICHVLKCKMCSPKCGYNQALSSLKEKIISDNQK